MKAFFTILLILALFNFITSEGCVANPEYFNIVYNNCKKRNTGITCYKSSADKCVCKCL